MRKSRALTMHADLLHISPKAGSTRNPTVQVYYDKDFNYIGATSELFTGSVNLKDLLDIL